MWVGKSPSRMEHIMSGPTVKNVSEYVYRSDCKVAGSHATWQKNTSSLKELVNVDPPMLR